MLSYHSIDYVIWEEQSDKKNALFKCECNGMWLKCLFVSCLFHVRKHKLQQLKWKLNLT